MNGVEIVSQEIIYETTVSLLPLLIAIIACAMLGFVVSGREVFGGFDVFDGVLGAIEGVIGGFVIGLLISSMTVQPTNEINYIKYTVIVNDSVLMNEFMDKYQILDQEGRVYTVIEKE